MHEYDEFFYKFMPKTWVRNPTFKKLNLLKANSSMSKQLKYKF